MRKGLISILALASVLHSPPALAKARLVAVFPVRSTAALAARAAEATHAVIERLGSLDGYDTVFVAAPKTGTLGAAAASSGAEFYVVGQLLQYDSGYQLTLGSFQTATDKEVGSLGIVLADAKTLPPQAAIANLITAGPTTLGAAPAIATEDGTEVDAGLPIAVHLDAPLTSSSAKVGDQFSFEAVDDVASGGLIIISKGSQGQGEIVQAESAGSNGHPGKLGIQFDWITAVDGSKIKMSVTPRATEGEGKGGAASTATLLSYAFLGPLGLFAHNFVKGKDITIDQATKLTGYVEHTVHVRATQKADIQGFAH